MCRIFVFIKRNMLVHRISKRFFISAIACRTSGKSEAGLWITSDRACTGAAVTSKILDYGKEVVVVRDRMC